MAEERKTIAQQKETNSHRGRASVKSLDMGRESIDSPVPPKRPSHKSLDLSAGPASPRATRSGSGEARKERLSSKDRKSDDDCRPSSPSSRELEPRGSYKNLPGIFMHVEEVVNPYDFMTPVAEPLFKKLLECINHSQVASLGGGVITLCRHASPKRPFKCSRSQL